MAIVNRRDLAEHANIGGDALSYGELQDRVIAAAQAHIERLLGYSIAERYPEAAPEPLKIAVLQLAAHWHEQRETVSFEDRGHAVPFGVWDIVTEWRDWGYQ